MRPGISGRPSFATSRPVRTFTKSGALDKGRNRHEAGCCLRAAVPKAPVEMPDLYIHIWPFSHETCVLAHMTDIGDQCRPAGLQDAQDFFKCPLSTRLIRDVVYGKATGDDVKSLVRKWQRAHVGGT